MWKIPKQFIISTLALSLSMISSAYGWNKGIYLTQYTLEKPEKLDYLIREAKATGINTFVIDHEYYSSRYAPAIAKVKAAGIRNVTRIVVFTDGGNVQQIRSQAHWEEKLKFAEEAIKAGADAIQLDYIRYSSKEPANPQHAKDVYVIIKWFKEKINAHNIPMEIDIFGEVSYHPSMHIGQDINMFADAVDGVNPMVYPSHFWPYEKYSADPYKTINDSLNALSGKFDHKPPFKIHAFIEAANYHYLKKTSDAEKQKYLLKEIRAVEDAKAVAGWYVWSANNVYENLFKVLKENKTKPAVFGEVRPAGYKPSDVKTATKVDDKKAVADNKTVNAQDKKVDAVTGKTAKVDDKTNTVKNDDKSKDDKTKTANSDDKSQDDKTKTASDTKSTASAGRLKSWFLWLTS